MDKKRSFSVKNKNMRNSLKSIELGIYPKDPIKEENESIKDFLNESQEDIINEEESDFQNVSNYQYYFELILSIIMTLNSFFVYSYLNILHLMYCFLLIYSRFIIEYNFWAKSKKTLMIILLIIDAVYLIAKSIFFIIFALKKEISDSLNKIFPYFNVEFGWKNYYEYSIIAIIIILILIYLIIGEFDEEFWKGSIFTKTSNLLKEKSSKINNILNFGFFFLWLWVRLYTLL